MNGYEDFPKCPVCGKPIYTYVNIVRGYVLTCSSKCGKKIKYTKHIQYPYFVSSNKLDDVFRDMLSQLKLDFHSDAYNKAIVKTYPYIWNYIYFRYDQLVGHKMPEKTYWFVNGLYEFPKCHVCGKTIAAFRNAASGYAKYCDGCCYDDPQHAVRISDAWHKHKAEDPEFLSRKMQKTASTKIKNGHSPTWNNSEKAQQTIESYLKDDPDWCKKRTQRGKQTKKERYGDENYNNPLKNKETCIRKYGVDSFSKTQEFIEKTKATNQKNFGADFVMQSESGMQLYKQSMLATYGVEWPSQTDEYKARWKTDKEFVEKRQQKMYATKRKNGTFKSSKPEDESYRLLCEVFGEDDVERQHKDEKYPFLCDFYIKSIELYIECNYHWTHGSHAFDSNNSDDLKQVDFWRQRSNEKKACNAGNTCNMYDNAIYVWTCLDVRKRKLASSNKLNYIAFWDISQLAEYLKQYEAK